MEKENKNLVAESEVNATPYVIEMCNITKEKKAKWNNQRKFKQSKT